MVIILLLLSQVGAIAQEDTAQGNEDLERIMQGIDVGDESRGKMILSDRSVKIKKLLNIARRGSDNGRLLAIRLLGELRAKEATDDLVNALVRDVQSKDATGLDSALHYTEQVHRAVHTALLSIGLPCRNVVIQRLALLGTAEFEQRNMVMNFSYGERHPRPSEMKALVDLFVDIEGKDCAILLLNLKLEREVDKEIRANLKSALALLKAMPEEEPEQIDTEKSKPAQEESEQPVKESPPSKRAIQQGSVGKNADWITVVLGVAVVVLAGAVVFLLLRRKGRSAA
jgi:hypothetical protein